LAIVNFECPIVEGKDTPIFKNGPLLKCAPQSVEMIKDAGFRLVTLANNHFRDQGDNGVKTTISTLKNYGIDYVGGGLDIKEASQTYYYEYNGKKTAVINCCEHEFSIADEDTPGSNPLNPIKLWYAIQDAKNKADYVLLIVHGGHEMYQLPSPRMQETYRFFIDAGADAVVNHHQHCYSGYEVYKEKPIIYGLGNFCMDDARYRNNIWNEGYMVIISFGESIKFELIPYIQGNASECLELMKGDRIDSFNQTLKQINSTILNPKLFKTTYDQWVMQASRHYLMDMMPYTMKVFKWMAFRGFLPRTPARKRLLSLYNKIICESHRDRLLVYIKRYLDL
jgi:poly-gamma-glutamate synthesis protein (capsule biosynthesis protein)